MHLLKRGSFAVFAAVMSLLATACGSQPGEKPIATARSVELHEAGGPWKYVTASTFYIGEGADDSNAHIDNISTAWDEHAAVHFGGADRWGPINPEKWDGSWYKRNGLLPHDFSPKQNPFYVALPTPDHDRGKLAAAEQWVRRGAAYLPELQQFASGAFTEQQSPFKNLWVQIVFRGKSVYAQLEDVGPSDKRGQIVADYDYVWGATTQPKNSFGLRAGIDISPAATDYLGTHGEAKVRWRFVPATTVPDGPWKKVITTAPPQWGN